VKPSRLSVCLIARESAAAAPQGGGASPDVVGQFQDVTLHKNRHTDPRFVWSDRPSGEPSNVRWFKVE
jgi:hypothetical protein